MHFKLPFIQEVRRFDKRVISWDGDPNQIPTRGEQFISVDTTARWRISDPLIFMQRVQNERGATMRLNDILDSVVRDKISATDLVEIVRSKDWKISEADLARVQLSGEDDEEILLQEVKTGRQELVKSIYTQAASQMPEMGIELIDIRINVSTTSKPLSSESSTMIAERQRIAERSAQGVKAAPPKLMVIPGANSLRSSLRPTPNRDHSRPSRCRSIQHLQ